MGLMSNVLSKSTVGALAVGAMMALTSVQAEASIIRIEDLSGGGAADVFVGDTGSLAQAFVNAAIIGGMSVSVTATPSETPGLSNLNSVSVSTEGAGKVRITVSENGFSQGAGAPLASQLAFSLSGTKLSEKGVFSKSFVDDGNALEAKTDQVGGDLSLTGPLNASQPPVMDRTTDTAVLSGLFSITSVFEIEHTSSSDVTSFDANVLAAVPLPAGGLLLLTALGGVAALRRKRKAA